MKKAAVAVLMLCVLLCFSGCNAESAAADTSREAPADNIPQEPGDESTVQANSDTGSLYTTDSRIEDVMHDPVFGDYGRLIFPADTAYWSGDTLAELRLTWYSNIDPDMTVEIVNYLKEHAQAGDTVFYDIYTDEERPRTRTRRTQACSFSGASPAPNFPCAMPAALLPTSGPCRTASRTLWSCRSGATTPLR